jgi:hypothetical protein
LIADNTAMYQSRALSDAGRLFFNSPDKLVSELPGGEEYVHKENVYEFEPDGVGSCANPSGCIGLLTSGTSNHESAFIDANQDGTSVFFLTPAQLLTTDQDNAVDVYDARVCTASSPCIEPPPPPAPPCDESATCQGEHTPSPTFEVPATIGFSGTGNVRKEINRASEKGKPAHKLSRAQLLRRELKKCHKLKRRKKRNACIRRAHKRFGAKKAAHRGSTGTR